MSSKGKGRTLELEQIRKAEERAAHQSSEVRKKSFVTVAVILAAVAGLTAWIMFAPAPPGIPYPSQGNFHLSDLAEPHVPYNSAPPSSGPHFGGLAPWGVSEEAIPPELFIHNLEDAGAVFVYNCPTECADFSTTLAGYVEGRPEPTLVLTPYDGAIQDPDGTSYRAAAITWSRVFYFDDLTDDVRSEIDDFIGIYHGVNHHAG